jgi:uncharacterized protein (TIGR00369 family)
MVERIEKNSSISDSPEFPNCFVCGKDNTRGLRVRFFIDGEGVKASFTPDETLVGYEDTVHGGIISALLDEAIIWAVYAATKRFGVTAEINVRFRKPLPVQEECIVLGRMLEDRGRLWIAEGEILDEEGNLYAGARGKVVPVAEKEMKKVQDGSVE